MKMIQLDARDWKSSDDFIADLKAAIGAPDWHGSSVNAFVDFMATGGVNSAEPPCIVKVINLVQVDAETLELIAAISDAIESRRVYHRLKSGEEQNVRLILSGGHEE